MDRLFKKCNDYQYEFGGCRDWNMLRYCIQNKYYTFDDRALYDDDGNLLDDDWAYIITVQDLVDACEECGVDLNIIADFFGFRNVEQMREEVRYSPRELAYDVTYIVELGIHSAPRYY